MDRQPAFATEHGSYTDMLVEAYQHFRINYPKFFKMDLPSRTALIASELLGPYPGIDHDKTAVVITTRSGCIEVDKKFEESRQTVASPALFVYTLPNIMLGEICIRQGFKGEQICLVDESPDWHQLSFIVQDQLQYRQMEACLCGFIEATHQQIKANLCLVGKVANSDNALPFTADNLEKIFHT